jgi:hypothetical protein
MFVQVNAYTVMDQLQLQVTRMEATEDGTHWAHLLMDAIDVADLDAEDPWDLLWAIADRIMRQCMDRIEVTRGMR